MTVEMRHLRCFLAIAEERNITAAAGRSNLSQPALSRTLAQLERQLGVRLVDRSTHHVELSEAGVRFEQFAFDAVRAFERALAAAGGPNVPVRLGHSWSAGTYLSAIVRAWNAKDRPCGVTVIRSTDRFAGLTSGTVDAALTRSPVDRRRFRHAVLAEEPRVVALRRDHRLARRRRLALEDLSSETLVPTRVGVTTPELWPESSRPATALEVYSVDDWLVSIASGDGFGVSVASTAVLHPHPDVRYIPLGDAPPVPLLLAWPRQGEHLAMKQFVAVATASVGT